MRSKLILLAVATTALRAYSAPQIETVGSNFNRYTVDAATNVDSISGTMNFISDSLAVRPDGTLISADSTGTLFNVSMPVPLFVGNTGFTQIGDLDYANGGLWGFSNANQTLFFYDFSASMVTSTLNLSAFSGSTVTGVAYRPSNGSIYLSAKTGFNADKLYEVPLASSSATFVGSMAQTDAFSYISDIDFDSSGNLYAMTWFHRDFYTVNPLNGNTTLVSNGPHRDVNGMAILGSSPTQPVPEPATGLLAVGCGFAAWRRRRK